MPTFRSEPLESALAAQDVEAGAARRRVAESGGEEQCGHDADGRADAVTDAEGLAHAA